MIKAFMSRPLWVQTHVANHLLKLDEKLTELGFEISTVGTNITSFASPFEEVVNILKTCHCSIILGLPFLRVSEGKLKDKEIEKGFALPSEWNQIEAAISLMLEKPTLMMLHRGVSPRGLFDRGAANVFIHEFHTLGSKWVEDTVPKLIDLKAKVLAQQSHPADARSSRG
ncbi:MAG: hypothetical protein M0Q95_14795 [Porticoccaceae bacterium]|nr:hypothetical protein [Porticoccaceae bacterium]